MQMNTFGRKKSFAQCLVSAKSGHSLVAYLAKGKSCDFCYHDSHMDVPDQCNLSASHPSRFFKYSNPSSVIFSL